MRLALSTAAVPGLALDAFEAACRARGLDGAELFIDENDDVSALVERVLALGVRVVALRCDSIGAENASALAVAAARLNVPVATARKAFVRDALQNLAQVFAEAGARLLLSHGSELAEALARISAIDDLGTPASLGLAWELRPSTESFAEASAVLFAASPQLGLVRLYGGGPEQKEQDGRGLGPLLANLTLFGYEGAIVLCPSDERTLPKWRDWLASTRSAGCGSRANAEAISVDVRDIEPRDRLEIILGAYRSLMPGATLDLTVDHDPSCMYYTLRATEPEGSFAFKKLEDGPEVWRAQVTRL